MQLVTSSWADGNVGVESLSSSLPPTPVRGLVLGALLTLSPYACANILGQLYREHQGPTVPSSVSASWSHLSSTQEGPVDASCAGGARPASGSECGQLGWKAGYVVLQSLTCRMHGLCLASSCHTGGLQWVPPQGQGASRLPVGSQAQLVCPCGTPQRQPGALYQREQ